jgi:hypothetical protein
VEVVSLGNTTDQQISKDKFRSAKKVKKKYLQMIVLHVPNVKNYSISLLIYTINLNSKKTKKMFQKFPIALGGSDSKMISCPRKKPIAIIFKMIYCS